MIRSIPRALVAAVAGALAGVVALAGLYAKSPDLTFEFDRDFTGITTGVYPAERVGQETFAWTAGRADVILAGLDRSLAWRCVARWRGGRPESIPQPSVTIEVDGVAIRTVLASNAYEDLEIAVPARGSRSGLRLTIATTPTFLPGPSDRRALGVQIDRLTCERAQPELPWPPYAAIAGAAISGAAFGAAFALAGISLPGALLGALLLGLFQAVPLSHGPAPFAAYATHAAWLAIGVALPAVVAVQVLERWRRDPFSPAARLVAMISAAVVYLKLLGLLHPSKLIIDAVFHAHRLDWVLDGRFFFTQPMPNGVSFPYAIALYVFAAPWSLLTGHHVELLRIIVTASEAIAGALLYWMIVRTWGDQLTGVAAVVLFHLVPLPYIIVGNANLTNAFGQSASLVTVAAATIWTLQTPPWGQFVALTVLAMLAFLSHVSTVSMLMATLIAIAVLYWWRGGPALRRPARSILLASIIAAVLSVALYYGHPDFHDVYRKLSRVSADTTASETVAPPSASVATTATRVKTTAGITVQNLGWPLLVLAGIGVLRFRATGARDRLALVVLAYGITYLAFAAFGTFLPVGPRFERYAAEFIGRVDFATYPAAVILAARGAAWMLRAGLLPRLVAVGLVVFAAVMGFGRWYQWFGE